MNRYIKYLVVVVLLIPVLAWGASNYPAAMDTDSNLHQAEPHTLISPSHHNALKDAIEAIEGFVGSLTSSDPTSLQYRLLHLPGRTIDFDTLKPRATFFIPAGAFIPTKLSGALEPGAVEVGSSYKKTIYPLEFVDAASTGAMALFSLPTNTYLTSGINVRAIYTFKSSPNSGETIKWRFKNNGLVSGDDLDTTPTTSSTVSDSIPTGPTTSKLYVSAWAPMNVLDKSGQMVVLQVERDTTDTSSVNTYLLGVQVKYEVNKPDAG